MRAQEKCHIDYERTIFSHSFGLSHHVAKPPEAQRTGLFVSRIVTHNRYALALGRKSGFKQQTEVMHAYSMCVVGKNVSRESNPTTETESLARAVHMPLAVQRDLARLLAGTLEPGLYLIATPIGNLADITLRALGVLARADIVCCEDTRHSAKLLQHYAIHAVTRAFHEHNEDAGRPRLLKELQDGKRIAVISDAGTPLISDPGFKLVRECAAAGIPVTCIPGPSSVVTALAASGLPCDAFFFSGFLPPKQAARRVRIGELKAIPGTLVLFETPQRVAEALIDLADVLGVRDAVVAREMTKLHEEFARGTLAELAASFSARDIKGEVVLLIAAAKDAEILDRDVEAALDAALTSMSLKDAAKAVADALGVPKSRVYNLGLKLKQRP